MEVGYRFRQAPEFFVIKQVALMTTSKNQVQIFMGNIVLVNVVKHTPERCDARSCADEEEVFLDWVRQSKNSLGTAESKRGANRYVVEQVIGACSPFQQYDHQFNFICSIWPGCNGITSPSFVRFLMNRKIKRYKLSGIEIQFFHLRNLHPETSGIIGFFFYSCNNCLSPGL